MYSLPVSENLAIIPQQLHNTIAAKTLRKKSHNLNATTIFNSRVSTTGVSLLPQAGDL